MKYLQTLILIAILSSCGTYQHGNFNKQKFTHLKRIDVQNIKRTEKNAAPSTSNSAVEADFANSAVSDELNSSTDQVQDSENIQDNKVITKQIVSKKIKAVKTRLTPTFSKVKTLLSIKRIQQKHAKNNGAMAAGIIGAIVFFCLAVLCGLMALAFFELGFSGLFWGAAAGVCLLFGILFLVLGLTQGN
jgi:hypothetical protein